MVINFVDLSEKYLNFLKINNCLIFHLRIPNVKLHSLDTKQDGEIVLRLLSNQKQKPIYYRENRPYIVADKIEFEPNQVICEFIYHNFFISLLLLFFFFLNNETSYIQFM